jgi:alpha-ribazole phosphatase
VSRLVLVRHCEPDESARGRCYGTLDVGLSPAGHEEAEALVERLRALAFDAVWSSPRLRARQTAEPVASARGIRLQSDDDLRELDFGELEGRTYEEIAATRPELYEAWMSEPTSVRFPGGESYADLQARAVAALDRIQAGCESALVVTHGGIVRAALAAWLRLPDESVFRLDQRYGGITIVDRIEDVPVVRLLNGKTAVV